MSDNLGQSDLQKYLEKLLEQAKPDSNDERHHQYVININKFLKYFGKEQIHLLGSTAEQLKLRSEKDGGDADFLLCSGKLEIPVENLEFRSDTPCFVWIKGDELKSNLNVNLINGKYLPSSVLKEVRPELFTIVRGIFHLVSTTADNIPGRESRVTSTGIMSKVGLARTEYRNLDFKADILPKVKKINAKLNLNRSMQTKRKLQKRRKEIPFISKDMECLNNVLEVIALCKKEGKTSSNSGQLQRFGYILELVLKRQRDEDGPCTYVPGGSIDDKGERYYQNDLDTTSDNEDEQLSPEKRQKRHDESTFIPDVVRATYASKTSKDFVPALHVIGKLPCMEKWRDTTHGWLSDKVVEEIYEMDVFLVAKQSPKDPDCEKDMCLSFNLAEVKLSKCMSASQRLVLIILKSYLKGIIAEEHRLNSRILKLSTFHLKTTLYWVLEKTDKSLWFNGNILEAIQEVLAHLTQALKQKELLHYFTLSNLFAGFTDEDCSLLLHCIETLQADPIEGIKRFLEINDGKPVEIEWSRDEIISFLEIADDGGESKEADTIEDAMIDFQRGFNDGPRDADGNSPINEAILAITRLFIQDTAQKKIEEGVKKLNVPKEFSGFFSAFASDFARSLVNSDPGEELFSLLQKYLYCSSKEEKKTHLMLLKEKAELYFK